MKPSTIIGIGCLGAISFMGLYFGATNHSDPSPPKAWSVGPGFIRSINTGQYPNVMFETEQVWRIHPTLQRITWNHLYGQL
jgi:hypothetical protein